jgi:hypothetical protein
VILGTLAVFLLVSFAVAYAKKRKTTRADELERAKQKQILASINKL